MRILILRRRWWKKIAMGAGLAAVALLLAVTLPEAASAFSPATKELPVYGVALEQGDKRLSISFDAAWGDEKTLGILDILDEYDVKATFFLTGFWVDAYPEHVREIEARGHELGNHSATHPHMSALSAGEIEKELSATTKKINACATQEIRLFRPPFGDYGDTMIRSCRALGYEPIQWTVDSLDWKDQGTEAIVKRVTGKAGPGDIVLFHNNSEDILNALPLILKDFQAKGYAMVPIGELLWTGETVIDTEGLQHPK